jgi:hypothetical protein
MRQHPKIRFIATGDVYQNPAVEKSDHIHRRGDTWKQSSVINWMFPSKLRLQVIKRVTNNQDRVAYPKLKQDLFSTNMNVREVVNKHQDCFGSIISNMNKLVTKMNICHSNETRSFVNSHIQNDKAITKGQKMILRGYIKGMVRNGVYTLLSVKNRRFKNKAGKTFTVTPNQYNLFELPYCMTSYAMQGLTHDGAMTIFDIDKPKFLSATSHARSFWTAITRATTMKNVHIFIGDTKNMTNEQIDTLLARKLKLHKVYDLKNSMLDDEDFVTISWVKQQLTAVGMRCIECGIQMSWTGNRQFSVDRIDNTLGHTMTNSRVICCSCNKVKH